MRGTRYFRLAWMPEEYLTSKVQFSPPDAVSLHQNGAVPHKFQKKISDFLGA